MEEEDDGDVVKSVLGALRAYLHSNLPLDKDFFNELGGRGLLASNTARELAQLAGEAKKDCVWKLVTYMEQFYTKETLLRLCDFLDEHAAQQAKPRLATIASRIRQEILKRKPQLPPPVAEDTLHRSAGAHDDEEVLYPVIPPIKEEFSELVSEVFFEIEQLNKEKMGKLHTYLSTLLGKSSVPETVDKLKKYLGVRWNELNPCLLQSIVRHLKNDKLTKMMTNFEQTLSKEGSKPIGEFTVETVQSGVAQEETQVSVKIDQNPDQQKLEVVVSLCNFFPTLKIVHAMFRGFKRGCTVLFFSIPTECVWSLPSCLLPSNLSLLEEWKVLSLSVKGAFTVYIKERRVIDSLYKISQPMHHNLRQPSSNSSASGSSSSQFPPGQVGSVTSITGSGISSAGNSDILPEKNAQNRLRQSAKGHPLITDVLFATQGSSPSNQQRAMPTLRKPGNPLQLPTLPKEQEKSKLSPTSNQKSTLVGFVSTLGQNSSSKGTSPGSTGVGKSLLLGAMGGPSAYLSSLPGKVQICIAAMASEQDSPNVGENDFLRVSDSLSADSSSFNIDEPQPLLEPESQIAGFLQPLDDVEHRGQRNIIKEHLPVPFGTGSISPKEFQLATINPSGKDLPKDTTISPVEENPEHLLVPPITTAEAQLTFSKQNQGNDVQNPSDDTRKPSSRDQQSLSGKVSTLQPQSDYVDELKKSASRELEKTPATEEITRKKMEEIKSLVKQLYVKVNEPDARRFTSLERSVEDRFRTVHDYMGIIAQQMEVLNKVTGLSPDSSVEEAWKALLSQSVDRFEPGMFFEVNPCIISYECSTRPNGKALVYVRESFKGLLERIISVHNAHRAQSTTSDHDSTTNATQDRMESNTATGSTTATDQTNPVVTATERHTDESPASTTTAITTPITGNTDELTPITGNAIEPTPITGDPDEPTPNTGLGNKYLVTGTPGTGKSCFAYYLLHHLLAKEGDSVLYQNCHNNMKYFVVITRLEGNNFDVASYQMPNNGIPKPSHGFLGKGEDSVSKVKPVSWYIFDSGHKSGAKPESTDVPTIVISSPDCDQYKDFMLKGPEKFYMPTWEWEEIDALVRQLHPDKSAEMDGSIQRAREDCRQEENNNEKKKERIAEAFQTFSELARASEAFIRHGGVIRDVLNTDSEDRLLKSLHKAVDRSNVEMVLQFLQARGDVSSAVSYRILHQKCDKRLENGRLDYQNPSIHFASKYVHDRFWDKHRQKKADLTIEQLSLMYELMPPD